MKTFLKLCVIFSAVALCTAQPKTTEKEIVIKSIETDGDGRILTPIKQGLPKYPLVARQVRVEGLVRATAIIQENGKLANISVYKGPQILCDSVREAIKKWQYQPILLNGKAIKYPFVIEVTFTLNEPRSIR